MSVKKGKKNSRKRQKEEEFVQKKSRNQENNTRLYNNGARLDGTTIENVTHDFLSVTREKVGCSYTEIADKYNIDPRTVEKRVGHGLFDQETPKLGPKPSPTTGILYQFIEFVVREDPTRSLTAFKLWYGMNWILRLVLVRFQRYWLWS